MRFKNKHVAVFKYVFFSTLVIILSCNGCDKGSQREIKVAQEVPVHIFRFDRELFSLVNKPDSIELGLAQLKRKYGQFYHSYAEDVLNMPLQQNDSLFVKPMKMLLGYKPMLQLQQAVDSAFPDLTDVETVLSKAISIYKQSFPEAKLPTFVAFTSEFGYANIVFDSAICIGLDMYMNNRFIDYYRAYEFPEFMIRKLNKSYMAVNAIKALGISKYEHQTNKDKRFLATMVLEGKIRYFIKALIPDIHDSLLMGYTTAQWEWSKQNEAQIWTHLIEQQLLYQSEPSQFMRYFNDGPFTSAQGVPPESAPMIGTWMGLQMVRAYMQENPDVSLKQLMDDMNPDMILKRSKYRPQ
ncbi:MAG: hypothetical protein MUE96_07495 [Bacteroidia bacterium]|jgi:hypothetical protein|nr:hypothetical protein [Bacteroidia bacterium]